MWPEGGSAPNTVTDGLTRVTSILFDVDDQLTRTIGEEQRVHPRAWTPALDDFHTVVVELVKLAAAVQGHHHRWAGATRDATDDELAAVAEAVDALGHAWDALTLAAEAISVARRTSIHRIGAASTGDGSRCGSG